MIEVWVPGIPQTKGSTSSFVSKKTGKLVTISANPKLKGWQKAVEAALRGLGPPPTLNQHDGLRSLVVIALERPASHFTKTGALKRTAPKRPARTPDLDKQVRAIWDGVEQSGFIENDSRFVSLIGDAVYVPACPGAWIEISEAPAELPWFMALHQKVALGEGRQSLGSNAGGGLRQ